MAMLKVATLQFGMSENIDHNLKLATEMLEQASTQGAQLALLPELFYLPYFCKVQNPNYFKLAHSAKGHKILDQMSSLAKKLKLVLPISFFEQANQCYFNSLAMIDNDGKILEVYRKSHIPDGPGYQEKFYFSPGDTGFKVWQTQLGKIGTAICWDQWFPEAARILALKGAEIICYPTAIGSEPQDPSIDSKDHWQRIMQGHAAANVIPVLAANRIGNEQDDNVRVTFYGSSFITDHYGKIISEAPRDTTEICYAEFDLGKINQIRHSWGLFRDRRPDLYSTLSSLDGERR